ncbi:MAG: prolipoprotein diacylglyceryl transferase, partial [Acidothermaceae bacterium]
ILGLRLNDWTCIIVFAFGLITFIVSARRSPGRETVVEPGSTDPTDGSQIGSDDGGVAETVEVNRDAEAAGIGSDVGSGSDVGVVSDERPPS